MKQLLHQRHFQICAALIAADCSVFTLVDPLHASAVWLITGYILFGLTLFSIAGLLAAVFRGYGERTHLISKRLLRYAAITGVVLIGLQSIGQLTVKDVLTLLPFAAILYLYYGYGRKLAAERSNMP